MTRPFRALWAVATACLLAWPAPAHAGAVPGLPLLERPAANRRTDLVAVVLTGDGGWAPLVRGLTAALNDGGVSVVGWDMPAYFSTRRTPDETAQDLIRVLDAYATKWQATRFALVGYSRGADALPFMLSRLPAAQRARIVQVSLLGLEPVQDFEYHVTSLLGQHTPDAKPVRPELDRLLGMRLVCVYGADEKDSLCPALPDSLIRKVRKAGGHHFDGDYRALGREVLDGLTAP